ncbi:hypothetical protein BDD12DRAFT_373383 [Trichophaea hybrida]|nr:hypothetical protein BDD12DRAFT_373383 [Trichophaea hybrida]
MAPGIRTYRDNFSGLEQSISFDDTDGEGFGPPKILPRRSTLRSHPESQDSGDKDTTAGDRENGSFADDEDTITDCHRDILRLFDGRGWKPLEANVDPKDEVLALINKSAERAMLRNSLNKYGLERRTLLHTILTAKSQSAMTQRRDLFRWLMAEYPELYKEEEETGMTVLSWAIQRASREIRKDGKAGIKPEIQQANMYFVKFFVGEFPEQTSELLRKETSLIHQLLPMIRGNDSCLKLLYYLDRDTVMLQDSKGNTVLHLAVEYKYMCNEDPTSRLKMKELIKILLNKCPDALIATNDASLSPYQHRVATFRKCSGKGPESCRDVPLQGDPIALLLKDRYMHLENREETIKYLHGDSQEYEIHFDLTEISTSDFAVSEDSLRELVNGLKFEDILEYVRIPRCKISRRVNNATAPSFDGSSGRGGIGLTAFQLIFELLWSKGVRKIIRVIVDDEEDTPHSDEVIESLRRFEIEDWDWKKVDMCSEVLRNAAPDAEKITLYCSGNNAILRSWSAEDGLKRLQRLKEINVYVRQRLESESRINMYVKTFKQRMRNHFPSTVRITVTIENHTGKNESTNQWYEAEKVSKNAGTWLKNMDEFARFIRNIPSSVDPRKGVKVAVLDDGIDMLRPEFRDCIKEGISFFAPTNRKTCCAGPYYFSSRGHGTLMASLIRRVCPKAELYIARLNQGISPDGQRVQLTAESAAKAIRWAIRKKVDIISMSWTIAKTEKNKDGIAALENAIKEAHEEKILMFGAANDQGGNDTDLPYPAKGQGVFCIGAATEAGTPDGAGDSQAQYVFPGGSIGINAMRGSSAGDGATELASGTDHRKQLTDFENMNGIFDSMATRKYIEVKKYFESKCANSDWEIDGERELSLAVDKIIRGDPL